MKGRLDVFRHRITVKLNILIPLSIAVLLGASSSARLAEVESHYDIARAQEFVEQVRDEPGHDALLAEALLVLAELHRIEFEALDESQRAERRTLGNQIDDLADEALELIDGATESSHALRLEADLLAVKIRSNYQAKKYRKQMERAAARAIELDPGNAAAYVSAAKPYLFADEDHRGDIDYAIELLETALALAPEFEKAHLLLAHAMEQQGEVDRARQRYETALETNPDCRPARDALARLGPANGSP